MHLKIKGSIKLAVSPVTTVHVEVLTQGPGSAVWREHPGGSSRKGSLTGGAMLFIQDNNRIPASRESR